MAAARPAASLNQHAQALAATLQQPLLTADKLGAAFWRVTQMFSQSQSDGGAHQSPSAVASASADVLQQLEQPLQARVAELQPHQAVSVLAAWARSHQYQPPVDLTVQVAAQLYRQLDRQHKKALAAESSSSSAGYQQHSTGSTPIQTAEPEQQQQQQQQGVRPWMQAFIPVTQHGGGLGTASGTPRSPSSAPSVQVNAVDADDDDRTRQVATAAVGTAAGRQLAAISSAVVSLSFIAQHSVDHSTVAQTCAADLAPLALALLRQQLQHTESSSRTTTTATTTSSSSSSSSTGTHRRHSGKAPQQAEPRHAPPPPEHHAVALLWGSSRLPPLRLLQARLQLPVLELLTPRVSQLDASRVISLVEALSDIQVAGRQAAGHKWGSSGSSLLNDVAADAPVDEQGQIVQEAGHRSTTSSSTTPPTKQPRQGYRGRLHSGGRHTGAGAGPTPAPHAMPVELERAVRRALAAATARMEALAPGFTADQVAVAGSALARLCGSHHKFSGDHTVSSVSAALRPLTAMADALVATRQPADTARSGQSHGHVAAAAPAVAAKPAPAGETAAQRPLSPQLIVALAGAYARMMCGHVDLFNLLARDAVALGVSAFSQSHVAALVWAFASTNTPNPPLMAAVCGWAVPRLSEFSPLQLCNVLWACAVLRHDDPALLAAAARVVDGWRLDQLHWSLVSQLMQVHNVYTMHEQQQQQQQQPPATGGPLFALPAAAVPAMRRLVAAHRAPYITSLFHIQVLSALRDQMQLPVESEVTLLDGGLSVDVLVQYKGQRVAVEADGPWHYTRSAPRRRNGKSALRDRMLIAAGMAYVAVPVHLWQRLRPDERVAFLRQALDAAVAEQHAERVV